MNNLQVYLHAERTGTLKQDDGGLLRFSYDQAWLQKPGAIPLSRSLPLQHQIFSGKKTRPFFAGILPEDEPRKKIAEILGISVNNDFALLKEIGGECAGAVSLLPKGAVPPEKNEHKLRELNDKELQKIVQDLRNRPLMAGTSGMRLSLAGAQDKLPVIVFKNIISLPLGNTASTHILKPDSHRFPGLAVNELFCMSLAQAVGLNVAGISFRLIGKTPCVLVRRYDRIIDTNGMATRLHQEDFCQAMGIPPERKYQAEGGPTLSDCVSLLRDWSSVPVVDIPHFINGLIFNVLIGNADAHGKNFSFLYSGAERRLAPFYDLVSTMAWSGLSKNLAMKIGDGESVNAFAVSDWKKMAKKTMLGWPMIRERMLELSNRVLDTLDKVRTQTIGYGKPMVTMIHKTIGERADRMIENLSGQN